MISERDIFVTTYSDDKGNVTVAHITDTHSGDILATGSAKRTPGDPRHSCVGEGLAIGRAFKSLGEGMIKHATALSES